MDLGGATITDRGDFVDDDDDDDADKDDVSFSFLASSSFPSIFLFSSSARFCIAGEMPPFFSIFFFFFSSSSWPRDEDDEGAAATGSSSTSIACPDAAASSLSFISLFLSVFDFFLNFPNAFLSAVLLCSLLNSSAVTFVTLFLSPAPFQSSSRSGLLPLLLPPTCFSTLLIVQHPFLPISVCNSFSFTSLTVPHFSHVTSSFTTSPLSFLFFLVRRSPPSLLYLPPPLQSIVASAPLSSSSSSMEEAPGDKSSRPMADPTDDGQSSNDVAIESFGYNCTEQEG